MPAQQEQRHHKEVIEALGEITSALREIHTLVNSNLTGQMNDTLDATVRDLASLKLVVELRRQDGVEPTPEAAQVIEATEGRIAELRAKLRDRAAATEIGQAEAKAGD
jgi:hypothetical protein